MGFQIVHWAMRLVLPALVLAAGIKLFKSRDLTPVTKAEGAVLAAVLVTFLVAGWVFLAFWYVSLPLFVAGAYYTFRVRGAVAS